VTVPLSALLLLLLVLLLLVLFLLAERETRPTGACA